MQSRSDNRQTSLPGTGADLAGLARLKAAAPLKPKKTQEPCDVGLFGDSARQTDLVDLARQKKPDPETELRALWTAQGVPLERQNQIIAEVIAKAQPGTPFGPWKL